MLKSNKKKGFSLLEQLCAMSIFSIMSISIITIQLNNLRLREYNKEILEYSSVLEALKQEILNNYSYDYIKNIYSSNKRYVNKDMLNISSIRSSNLNQIFADSYDNSNTYLTLGMAEGEVLKIHMEIHVQLKKEEIITCEFNKGNYL
jgi:prepilin-type N-terminal cleavage/methylation domain-containing protein